MFRPMRIRLGVLAALATVALQCSVPAQDRGAALDALVARCSELGLFNGTALVAERGSMPPGKRYGTGLVFAGALENHRELRGVTSRR